MLPANTPPRKRKSRRGQPRVIRHPGLMAAARALDVEHTHLYRVLMGQRPSASLLSRYEAYKANQTPEAAR